MNERDFIYWLSGFLESSSSKMLFEEQVQTIKDHLALVCNKKTPNNYGITVTPNQPNQIIVNPAFPNLQPTITC
jgi:hypothetical protein